MRLFITAMSLSSITDAYQPTILHLQNLLDELGKHGFGKSRLATIILYNRQRIDSQPPMAKVQEALGREIAQIISPAPELAYMAAYETNR